MTSVGADKTFAHSGAKLEFDPKTLPLNEGDRIADKYEVVRRVGSGAIAFVVAAKHIELGEIVAIKCLQPGFRADAGLVERFAREARAWAKIENEHVARFFDVGTLPDNTPFIVMEYVEGKGLGALLREKGTAPVACAVEYLLEGCEALAAAHASGVVHRDVKPDSLFLARSIQGLDVIKLIDFGISKVALTSSAVDGSGPRVKTMELTGTPAYMSPEQIRASTDLDARTDIWSLGCVLYELLAGHPPFEAASITLLTASILERPAPPLRERRPDVPEELEAVLARCLAKDPNRRFQSISQLAHALYPFAPRRAQLSVERCSQILRHAGLTPAPFIPQTIPPPNRPSLNLATTSATAAANARTTDEPTHVEMPLPTPATVRRWKTAFWAAVFLLVVAGVLAARHPTLDATLAGDTSVVTAAMKGTPPAAVAATATVDFTEKPTPSEADVLDTQTPPAASAVPKSKSRKPHAPKGTEEIDVGF
jgi:serine/threonine protein kinase